MIMSKNLFLILLLPFVMSAMENESSRYLFGFKIQQRDRVKNSIITDLRNKSDDLVVHVGACMLDSSPDSSIVVSCVAMYNNLNSVGSYFELMTLLRKYGDKSNASYESVLPFMNKRYQFYEGALPVERYLKAFDDVKSIKYEIEPILNDIKNNKAISKEAIAMLQRNKLSIEMAFKTGLLPADLIPQNNQCSVERSNREKLLEAFNFLGGFHDQVIHAIGALGGLQLLDTTVFGGRAAGNTAGFMGICFAGGYYMVLVLAARTRVTQTTFEPVPEFLLRHNSDLDYLAVINDTEID